jgi:alpha-beta hydrolase superfamily lysophospholipase
MNPDVKESEMPTVSSPDFAEPVLPPTGGTGDPLLLPPQETNESNEQVKQVVERFKAVLSSLPEYVSDFFSEYKRPLITLGLVLGGVITVKLTFALLDAVDDIPLLAPTFELIGFGYTAWFVYRYLLRASSRQELAKEVGVLKDQIVGNLPK